MSLINNKLEIIAKEFFKGNSSKFARVLGVTPTTINNYRNDTAPKFDFILDLVNKLGINWEWLIHDQGQMINQDQNFQEPQSDYNLTDQLRMYREYVETLKENNQLKQQQINDLKNQVNHLEKLLDKYRDK